MLERTDCSFKQAQGALGQVQWQLPAQSWHKTATNLKGESMACHHCAAVVVRASL